LQVNAINDILILAITQKIIATFDIPAQAKTSHAEILCLAGSLRIDLQSIPRQEAVRKDRANLMLTLNKQKTPRNSHPNTYLADQQRRDPVSFGKSRFPLGLVIILLPAFFVLMLQFPFSDAKAQTPEWRSSWINRQDALLQTPASLGELQESDVFLPFLFNKYPFTPSAPQLNAISNADGDGTYTVSWTSVDGGETYLLQEDDNSAFSSPTNAYEGHATSKEISGQALGTYYYRLMASNSYASSQWSNIRSVTVSQSQSACPQLGSWRGHTDQGLAISFDVEASPQCQIAAGSVRITVDAYPCGTSTTTFTNSYRIVNNAFVTGPLDDRATWVTGTFTSPTTADGTFNFYMANPAQPWQDCTADGRWNANPVSGANGPVRALLVQSDGKILLGGSFSRVGGQVRAKIARLNPNGSLDLAFNPALDGDVRALAIQDNQILVGGRFSQVNGQAHAGLARLNTDGSLDTTFNPQFEGVVNSIALQSDGKIIVGGNYTTVNGVSRKHLVRLNENGTLDNTFAIYDETYINALVVQPDDKIWLANWWDELMRLNPNGSLDVGPSEMPAASLALQPDGKLVVAGWNTIARLNIDGTVDSSFTPPEPNGNVAALGLLSNGRITVGGNFSQLGAQTIPYLGQLSSGGTLISTYKPEPNFTVYALAVQPDGKILVGGDFTLVGGQLRSSIARVNPDGSLDESFLVP
jgi:uncharacterized delta-60 repeat protein